VFVYINGFCIHFVFVYFLNYINIYLKIYRFDQSKIEYFINTEKYTSGADNYLLIKCSYYSSARPAITKCESEKFTLPSGFTELIYVNSNYGEYI